MRKDLKVFINKRNGQGVVHLPKKILDRIPDKVSVNIPNKYLRKHTFSKGLEW